MVDELPLQESKVAQLVQLENRFCQLVQLEIRFCQPYSGYDGFCQTYGGDDDNFLNPTTECSAELAFEVLNVPPHANLRTAVTCPLLAYNIYQNLHKTNLRHL